MTTSASSIRRRSAAVKEYWHPTGKMLALWKSIGQPGIVVGDCETFVIFLRVGGHAIVEQSLAQQLIPHVLEPVECAPGPVLGLRPLDAVPKASLNRAPIKKLWMAVIRRDDFRCLDHPVADYSRKQIKRRPVLGALINEYERPHRRPGQEQWPSSGTDRPHRLAGPGSRIVRHGLSDLLERGPSAGDATGRAVGWTPVAVSGGPPIARPSGSSAISAASATKSPSAANPSRRTLPQPDPQPHTERSADGCCRAPS